MKRNHATHNQKGTIRVGLTRAVAAGSVALSVSVRRLDNGTSQPNARA